MNLMKKEMQDGLNLAPLVLKQKDINILIINIYNLDCIYLRIPPSTILEYFRMSF